MARARAQDMGEWRAANTGRTQTTSAGPDQIDDIRDIGKLATAFEARMLVGRRGPLPNMDNTISALTDPGNSTDQKRQLAEMVVGGMSMRELSDLGSHQQQPLVEALKDAPFDYGGPRDTLLRAIANDAPALEAETGKLREYLQVVRDDPAIADARQNWEGLSGDQRWEVFEQIASHHARIFDYPRPQMQPYEKPREPYDATRFIYEFGEYQSPAMGGPPAGALRFNKDAHHLEKFERSFKHLTHELTHARDVAMDMKLQSGEIKPDSHTGRQIGRMQADFANGRASRSQRLMAGRIPYEYQATEQHAVVMAEAAHNGLVDPKHDVAVTLRSITSRADDPASPGVPIIKKLPDGVSRPRGHLSVTVDSIKNWRDSRKPAPSLPSPGFAPG